MTAFVEVIETDVLMHEATVVEILTNEVQGPPGPSGATASVSSDPNNRLTNGSDNRLFVPELNADPLAYYILAKS